MHKNTPGESTLYLGVDVGSTHTRAAVADERGRLLGYGQTGPGNHEVVDYPGLRRALAEATGRALDAAGVPAGRIAGAGFGVSGYDWPAERQPTLEAIATLNLNAPVEAVNDTLLGLLAGSPEGWGVAVVSGTGCNCRGWDRERRREGMVSGAGTMLGEAAGAGQLVVRMIQAVSHAWARRGPPTRMTGLLLEKTGCKTEAELIEGLTQRTVQVRAEAAPLVFQAAAVGDPVALAAIDWAGQELGGLVLSVTRQLQFETLAFDVVALGSVFSGGPRLLETLRQAVAEFAPRARVLQLAAPPVAGAVLLGMEVAGRALDPGLRQRVGEDLAAHLENHPA